MICLPKKIHQLKNSSTSSEKNLAKINIRAEQQLKKKGAITCFEELCELENFKPSLNFLYAMLGALEDRHWTEFKAKKGELLLALENNKDAKKY